MSIRNSRSFLSDVSMTHKLFARGTPLRNCRSLQLSLIRKLGAEVPPVRSRRFSSHRVANLKVSREGTSYSNRGYFLHSVSLFRKLATERTEVLNRRDFRRDHPSSGIRRRRVRLFVTFVLLRAQCPRIGSYPPRAACLQLSFFYTFRDWNSKV